MIAAALLLQAAVPGPVGPVMLTRKPCPAVVPDGEVVVCARRGEQGPRLKPLPPSKPHASDPFGFRLPGGGRGRVHAIHTELPGAVGNGMAVTLNMPFGHKPKR